MRPRRPRPSVGRGPDGFVIAEGAGLVFLEEREHAIRRGAKIYGEVVGYGASADAYHLTQPRHRRRRALSARCRRALADAKLNPEQIDYVNAHGTSTPGGRSAGAQGHPPGVRRARHLRLWVSSTKSMTGHLLGAAGGLGGPALHPGAPGGGRAPPSTSTSPTRRPGTSIWCPTSRATERSSTCSRTRLDSVAPTLR